MLIDKHECGVVCIYAQLHCIHKFLHHKHHNQIFRTAIMQIIRCNKIINLLTNMQDNITTLGNSKNINNEIITLTTNTINLKPEILSSLILKKQRNLFIFRCFIIYTNLFFETCNLCHEPLISTPDLLDPIPI